MSCAPGYVPAPAADNQSRQETSSITVPGTDESTPRPAQSIAPPDTVPGRAEAPIDEGGDTSVIPEEARELEREMDVLIGEGRLIGAGHFDEIQDRLEALEGDLDGATLSHLRGKLDALRNLSPQAETETSRYAPRTRPGDPATYPSDNYVPARPDPEYDYFTWTLPSGASPLRLSLPADIDDFLFGEHGGIGGFGLHGGGHIEGLDHPWIELKPGTPIRSWADGVVVDVRYNGPPGEGEYHITIDYGYNLTGVHMEIMTPYVEKGDKVLRGQEVGMGMSFDPHQTSAELSLTDSGRTDGVRSFTGTNVSPFDYLELGDKTALIDAYKRQVIEPYVASGVQAWGFEPYHPYLTNNLFLHDEAPGRLHGAWYLISSVWEPAYPNDLLTFIEADNPYYSGNNVLAMDDEHGPYGDWFLRGTFEADYENGRLVISNKHGKPYYGIFEIDESAERARLRIEYRTGSYPAGFSEKALTYVERSDLGRRGDASSLGVLVPGE